MLKHYFRNRVLKKASLYVFNNEKNWEVMAEAITNFFTKYSDIQNLRTRKGLTLIQWEGAVAENLSAIELNEVITINKKLCSNYPTDVEMFISSLSKSLRDLGKFTSLMRMTTMALSNKNEKLSLANIRFVETVLYPYKNQLPLTLDNWHAERIQRSDNAY